MKLRIGTRGSRLALIQTEMIKNQIESLNLKTENVIIQTVGDKVLDRPIAEVGGKGVFVDSIEAALREGSIDLAVHSGKDVPSVIADDFELYVITPRADDRDVLVMRKDISAQVFSNEKTSRDLVVGTSSPRRKKLLTKNYLGCIDKLLRGNVPTRVDKLRQGEYDGIILAAAGIDRLGLDLSDLDVRPLDIDRFIPATSQGIIVCEALKGSKASAILSELADTPAMKVLNLIMKLERILSSYMNADCYDAAAVNIKEEKKVDSEVEENGTTDSNQSDTSQLTVRWFYGDSPIYKETITLNEAIDIVNGRDRKWKKKIEESVI